SATTALATSPPPPRGSLPAPRCFERGKSSRPPLAIGCALSRPSHLVVPSRCPPFFTALVPPVPVDGQEIFSGCPRRSCRHDSLRGEGSSRPWCWRDRRHVLRTALARLAGVLGRGAAAGSRPGYRAQCEGNMNGAAVAVDWPLVPGAAT